MIRIQFERIEEVPPQALIAKQTQQEIRAAKARPNLLNEQYQQKLRQEYAQLISWAGMYDNCTLEAKKMIVAQFVKAVHVKRDYEIDIEFHVSFAEFQAIYLEREDEDDKKPGANTLLALTEKVGQAV